MSEYDLDPDDFDDEDDYEDAVEAAAEAAAEEEEYESSTRERRGGLRKHWADLTGASAFPAGPPEVSWPADVDAWRSGGVPGELPGQLGGLPDLAWPDGLSAVADPDAWRAGAGEDEDDPSDRPDWP